MSEGLLETLRGAIGASAVITDRGVLAACEVDWTGRFHGHALALVRPGSAGEVGDVLRACSAAEVGVVAQGGNTGLVAGAVPHGAVVLSTAGLDQLGPVDTATREVTAGAGLPLERLQEAAAGAGLAFGVDLAARGSATVGGMIATDAGGIHAVRYGTMRWQVAGVQAVLADGSVIHELPGRDLVDTVARSEGTLAVITEARLRLVPAWPYRATALASLQAVTAAADAVGHLRERLPDLDALELIDRPSLELCASRAGTVPPFPGPGPTLLVETAADTPTLDRLARSLASLPGLIDATLADDGPGRRRLWAFREGISDALASAGVPHKLDVRVPVRELPAFMAELGRTVAAVSSDAQLFVFGHLALGNLHVNVVGPSPDDERMDDAVLRLVAAHGGSIAGEHGIGRAKARWLDLARSPDELAGHAELKRILDPAGILNPGVL